MNELINSINNKVESIANQIVEEDDYKKVRDLTDLFNLMQAKKNALRILKLTGLLDKIDDQIIKRFEISPDNFSNKDLLDYLQIIQTTIAKANENLNDTKEISITPIQQNNQVNINIINQLDRESRDKVADTVKFLLKQMNTVSDENK